MNKSLNQSPVQTQAKASTLDSHLESAAKFTFASGALSPVEKAQELERIVGGLIDILDRENDLIIHKPLVNFERLKTIASQKQNLFEEYHGFISAVGSIKTFASDLSDHMQEHLKSLFTRYEETAETNERRLKIALQISARILDAVSNAQAEATPVLSYNQYGVLKKSEHAPLGIKQEI